MAVISTRKPPFLGAVVSYTLDRGPRKGQERPALVVAVTDIGVVNLQVSPDGHHNSPYGDQLPAPYWVTGVPFGTGPRTWRYLTLPKEQEIPITGVVLP